MNDRMLKLTGDTAELPDDPQSVECPDCWGDGVVYEPDGRNVQQRTPCGRCLGDGVVEADG